MNHAFETFIAFVALLLTLNIIDVLRIRNRQLTRSLLKPDDVLYRWSLPEPTRWHSADNETIDKWSETRLGAWWLWRGGYTVGTAALFAEISSWLHISGTGFVVGGLGLTVLMLRAWHVSRARLSTARELRAQRT